MSHADSHAACRADRPREGVADTKVASDVVGRFKSGCAEVLVKETGPCTLVLETASNQRQPSDGVILLDGESKLLSCRGTTLKFWMRF